MHHDPVSSSSWVSRTPDSLRAPGLGFIRSSHYPRRVCLSPKNSRCFVRNIAGVSSRRRTLLHTSNSSPRAFASSCSSRRRKGCDEHNHSTPLHSTPLARARAAWRTGDDIDSACSGDASMCAIAETHATRRDATRVISASTHPSLHDAFARCFPVPVTVSHVIRSVASVDASAHTRDFCTARSANNAAPVPARCDALNTPAVVMAPFAAAASSSPRRCSR